MTYKFVVVGECSIIQQFSGVSVIRAYVVKIFDEVFSHGGGGGGGGFADESALRNYTNGK
jgi:hypothetical protein